MEVREEKAQSSFFSWLVLGVWFFFGTKYMYSELLGCGLHQHIVILTIACVLVISATTVFSRYLAYASFWGYLAIVIWLQVTYGIIDSRVTSAFDMAFLAIFFGTYTIFALFLKNEIELFIMSWNGE